MPPQLNKPASHLYLLFIFIREQVRLALKELLQNPSEAEMLGLYKIVGNKALINEADFIKMLTRQRIEKDKGTPMEAFQWFDVNKSGEIDVAELKRVMMAVGDKLTKEEADEMIVEAKANNGKIKYEDFLKHMIHFVAK